ncbi:MAG: YheU family protein [Pseudomonadota bacterium]
MIIPYEKLSRTALQGLIEEFVTRDGSDSGYTKTSLEENVDMVMSQLRRGDAFIYYDEATLTTNIVLNSQAPLGRHEA